MKKTMLNLCLLNCSYMKTRYFKLLAKDGLLPKIYVQMVSPISSCICGEKYMSTKTSNINVRTRSSISDSRRQKVVLETSDPKIVIEKLPGLKVLPDTKLERTTLTDKMVMVRDNIDPYLKLIRWDKPIGSWLLFWPCSWSIALASIAGSPLPSAATSLSTMGLFLAGSFVMRGAGCTINDLWDKDYDKQVARTRDRPLVSGAISQKQAIAYLGVQLSVGLTILLQLNWYSVILGASSMLLVIMYPLAKRFTDYPQIFLGATFNWGALLGWSAITGSIDPLVCLPLYAGALCWTVVYDTIYAHQDKNDDARIGIKSTALKFGDRTKPLLSLWAGGALCGLSGAGAAADLAWPYYLALAAATAHVGRQIYTLDTENANDCANKFRSNSLVGLIIFLGIVGGGWRKYFGSRKSRNLKTTQDVS